MKILITGGCGFIGSHLVEELAKQNYNLIVVDDLSANNEQFYFLKQDNIEYHKLDIADESNFETLKTIAKDCKFVFHLAAETRIQDTINNPKKTIQTNILGTFYILELCRQLGVKGLLFSSTSSVYGLTENTPITENEKESCLNPYASTKYSAELLIKNYNKLYGVKSCIFRYFNVFGERAPAKGPYSLVTGIFLRQKNNGEPLTIVGDGTQERDFIYVKDIVDANILAMSKWDAVPEISESNVFNIGSEKAITVKQLADAISSNQTHVSPRKGEARTNLSSSNKFKVLTGWVAKTDILDWIKTQ
jgi:UDP-glucose 4-epimerase